MNKDQAIIVTGCNGFIGHHLIRYLKSSNLDDLLIYGIDRGAHTEDSLIDDYHQVDITDLNSIKNFIGCISTQRIWCFHLAGILKTNHPVEFFLNNVLGTQNLLEFIGERFPDHIFINVGSSAEYGFQGRQPIRESSATDPVSWYGLSKLMQTMIAQTYGKWKRSHVISVRIFNSIGPGQKDNLLAGKIVNQVGRCKIGIQSSISLGSTQEFRDFVDVRDIVRALKVLAEHGQGGQLYNIGTGHPVQIEMLLSIILNIAGIDVKVERTETNSSRENVPYQCADISKIIKATGWKPDISLEQSLKDMYAEALNTLSQKATLE